MKSYVTSQHKNLQEGRQILTNIKNIMYPINGKKKTTNTRSVKHEKSHINKNGSNLGRSTLNFISNQSTATRNYPGKFDYLIKPKWRVKTRYNKSNKTKKTKLSIMTYIRREDMNIERIFTWNNNIVRNIEKIIWKINNKIFKIITFVGF